MASCSHHPSSIQSSAIDPVIFSSIQPSVQSSLRRGILDGARRADQLIPVKKFILFLLAVRMIFLGLASLGCVFAIVSGFKDGVEWYWPVGGVLALGLCGFLIGQVWASMKATWKE